MPTYRSITTNLTSQFDILTIPEFEPPRTLIDPFVNAPTLINHDRSVVSVYIPTYPSSQFWLCYSISPPYPPKMLYYFKLYINGNHIVSWGCGEEENYEGKTMFGLYDAGPTPFKDNQIERRVLCFGPDRGHGDKSSMDNLDDVMEIKVFRSKGRRRAAPAIEEFHSLSGKIPTNRNKSQLHSSGNGINLVNAGLLPFRHPRRFYKYALLDPLDQPFATFRYYYRSWDRLEALGVVSPAASTESSSIQFRNITRYPLSRKNSNNTIDSYLSSASIGENSSANASTDTVTQPPSEGDGLTETSPRDDTISSTAGTEGSTYSPAQDFSSPLRAKITSRLILPRPPTPPAANTPPKLAQLPPTIPPTDTKLNTLASKESFTSLVRNHFPSPDRSAFQLNELVAEPKPTTPLRTRSTSMSTLMSVVSSATHRRRKTNSSDEKSEKVVKGAEYAVEKDAEGAGRDDDEEGLHRQKLVEKESETRNKFQEGKRSNSEEGSSSSRSAEYIRKKERRKLNMWEQL